MYEHFFDAENAPFAIALLLMVGLGLLEGVGTILGLGLSGFVDSVLPEFDIPDVGIELDIDFDTGVDADLGAPGLIGQFLGWITHKRVPVLIIFIAFLMIFGVFGLALQSILRESFGFTLPSWIAALSVGFVSLPFVRLFAGVLAKIIPKDESDAVSLASFVGRVAVILSGTATQKRPAQAKLRDQHGQTHYILVEPDDAVTFIAGEKVLIVAQAGAHFKAIKNTHALLNSDI